MLSEMPSETLSSHRNSRCRRLCRTRRQRRDIALSLAGITLLTRHGTAHEVGFADAIAIPIDSSDSSRSNAIRFFDTTRIAWCLLLRKWLGCMPARQSPDDAGEALELEWLAFPFATWGTGAIEGAETGVDGALVGFGTEFVAWGHEFGAVGSFVIPVNVSKYEQIKSECNAENLQFQLLPGSTRPASRCFGSIASLVKSSFRAPRATSTIALLRFPAFCSCRSRRRSCIGSIVERGRLNCFSAGG